MKLPPRIHVTTTPSRYAGTLKTVQHIIDLMREGEPCTVATVEALQYFLLVMIERVFSVG